MNKLLILLTVVIVCFACSRNVENPQHTVPAWLKCKIAQDEAIIKSDPKLMQSYGAWIRYEYMGQPYFEYDNPLSSLSRNPYSKEGDRINTDATPFTNYWSEKCCEYIVWKAPYYRN